MRFVERPNMTAVHYIASISYAEYKKDCLKSYSDEKMKPPKEADIKMWFNQIQSFCRHNIVSKGVVERLYHHSQTHKEGGLGGRYFCGGSLQGIWSVYRGCLMNGLATDIDMENCHPKLLQYICKKHNIPCTELEYYNNHRDEALSQFPSRAVGKTAYLKATNTDKFSRNKDLPDQFRRYDKEMKTIQKTLTEREDYNYIKDTIPYSKTYNYNGSLINRILCYYENNVLQACVDYINSKGYEIAVLMFDGLMIYGDHYHNSDLLAEIQAYVESKFTGLNMKWTYKPNDTSLEIPEDFNPENYGLNEPDEALIEFNKEVHTCLNRSSTAHIELLKILKPDYYIYSVSKLGGDKGEWFCWNESRWERSSAPLKEALIYTAYPYFTNKLKTFEKYEKCDNDNSKMYFDLKHKQIGMFLQGQFTGSAPLSKTVDLGRSLLRDYKFEFDRNPNLIGFENGVVDIEAECFRPYRFEDRVSMSVGYDFKPLHIGFNNNGKQVSADDVTFEDIQQVTDIIDIYEKIFPDDDLRDFFFKVISTGLSGRAIEKMFIFNGKGRNGKGFTDEFMEKVLGDYFSTAPSQLLTEDPASSSGPSPALAKIDNKRYVVMKEPKKDTLLSNSVVKDLTGGGSVQGRMLYSNKTDVKLAMTLILECNDKPDFREPPTDAEAERITDILFGSRFTGELDEVSEKDHVYLGDPSLKLGSWHDSHKNAMMNILLQHIFMVKKENYNLDAFKPDSVRQRSMAYLQNSYDIHKILIELFEPRNEENKDKYVSWKNDKADEDWTLAKIAQYIRTSPAFYELSRKKQKEYTADYIVKFIRDNRFYRGLCSHNSHTNQWYLRDWRKKPHPSDEDTDSESLS